MKRTTIRLDDQLLSDVKQLAAAQRRSVTSLVEDALRETLARSRRQGLTPRPTLPTFEGWDLRPGVDLDDGESLRLLMDRDDAVT
jgi:hypothetical protein